MSCSSTSFTGATATAADATTTAGVWRPDRVRSEQTAAGQQDGRADASSPQLAASAPHSLAPNPSPSHGRERK
jgi:hypothetical protein